MASSDDPVAIEAAKKRAENEDREWQEALKNCTKSSEGRLILWNALSKCGVYGTSFSIEPLEMARREGQRQIGLWLLNEIFTVNSEAYSLMRQEAELRDRRARGVE